MTPPPAARRVRTMFRWMAAIGVVCAGQVGLLFFLENRSPQPRRDASAAPLVKSAGGPLREWLALDDPTLFVLPHVRGFSGVIWQKLPSWNYSPPAWPEPEEFLNLPVEQLGSEFKTFLANTAVPVFEKVRWRPPEQNSRNTNWEWPVVTNSTLRLTGGLAKRRLSATPELPVQTSTDLLTNTVVQLLVDANGNTISAAMLGRGSGKPEADALALKLARAARFEPLQAGDNPLANLTVGRIIFEWQTRLVTPAETPAQTTP